MLFALSIANCIVSCAFIGRHLTPGHVTSVAGIDNANEQASSRMIAVCGRQSIGRGGWGFRIERRKSWFGPFVIVTCCCGCYDGSINFQRCTRRIVSILVVSGFADFIFVASAFQTAPFFVEFATEFVFAASAFRPSFFAFSVIIKLIFIVSAFRPPFSTDSVVMELVLGAYFSLVSLVIVIQEDQQA